MDRRLAELVGETIIDNNNVSEPVKKLARAFISEDSLDKQDQLLEFMLIATLSDVKGVMLAHHRATRGETKKPKRKPASQPKTRPRRT